MSFCTWCCIFMRNFLMNRIYGNESSFSNLFDKTMNNKYILLNLFQIFIDVQMLL